MKKMQAVADRLLEKFVPHASAQAVECDTLYRCVSGRQQQRKCCAYPSGISCTSWVYNGVKC
ncbi:hypothetical protein [Stackebrandtia soli]|uniref:hypothetical protein n=1 Tax=Stackebrandtia soli TaxID=1892856 RepID=UPI0039EB3C9F